MLLGILLRKSQDKQADVSSFDSGRVPGRALKLHAQVGADLNLSSQQVSSSTVFQQWLAHLAEKTLKHLEEPVRAPVSNRPVSLGMQRLGQLVQGALARGQACRGKTIA